MRIGLVELTEPSDAINYKPVLNTAFYKLLYTSFYCLYLCRTKSFVLNTELYFNFFLIWFGLTFSVTVFKILCFWAFFVRL